MPISNEKAITTGGEGGGVLRVLRFLIFQIFFWSWTTEKETRGRVMENDNFDFFKVTLCFVSEIAGAD